MTSMQVGRGGAPVAVKGRLVIDHYMEMQDANSRIRRVLHVFVVIVPIVVLASHGWSDAIQRVTTIR